jgi:hypothetical protein
MHPVKFDAQDPTWLTCPHCGQHDLHHDKVTVFSRIGEDGPVFATIVEGSVGVYRKEGPAVDRACPSSRRDGLAISFWCEHCPTLSELTIAQHKGTTMMQWRVVGHRMQIALQYKTGWLVYG